MPFIESYSYGELLAYSGDEENPPQHVTFVATCWGGTERVHIRRLGSSGERQGERRDGVYHVEDNYDICVCRSKLARIAYPESEDD